LEHYSENVTTSERGNIRKTYEELHEKWGLEIEFEEPDLNKELGFDVVDWRTEYIGKHIPLSVYEKIWNDSNNIATVMMQVAVLLELCEEFGFHKHKNTQGMPMMDKFLKGLKEKYKKMDRTECGTMEGIEELKQKYGIEVAWSKRIQETMNWFKF
jgi:hypothetical protein